ncbi:MAG: 3-hydroxyacyl-ACP dehydratase FabZ [Eggerthellaceae bacterium]|jgi:3-hydroxyacyl-[acyl-carrier-protein] dehydratase
MAEMMESNNGGAAKSAGQMETPAFPCGPEGVRMLIPHRDPFVWVTRILECDPGKHIVAELDVDPDLPLFKGHFPGKPVLPGVIEMEALAQAACCCVMADPKYQGALGLFAGIDKAKFRKQVLPGDTLRLEATITKAARLMCVAEVKAFVGDEVCAQAVQKYVIDRSR